ncbi:MAG TPA: hypothetical protein VK468_05355, partial [Pyrinomonadaceae bacterium]|nr:hypothetical protein [Pyrinomonadaceae bacterium]
MNENAVDDQGTSQESAREMLRQVLTERFHGSSEELSLAMGRPPEELERFLSGNEPLDDDFVM